MKQKIRRRERGYILIVAVTMTVVLTLLGVLVLDGVFIATKLAGADRNSQSALYIAEAGIAWAMEHLNEEYEFNESSADYNGLLTAVRDLTTVEDPDWPAVLDEVDAQGNKWYRLHPDPFISYGAGTFRVVIKDDEDDDDAATDNNQTILLRVYATTRGGARKLLEIALSSSCEQ